MVDYPTLAGRVCQLAGTGTLIAPGDITTLLTQDDTLIERVVFDGPNRVRDISTARTFRGTLRHILQLTHPRCDDPTCHIPAKHCQGDHITPWSQGGPTSQHNGTMGCPFHNRLWHHHPHHRPPHHQRGDPPGDPGSHTADNPAGHPDSDPAHQPPGRSPADDPPDELLHHSPSRGPAGEPPGTGPADDPADTPPGGSTPDAKPAHAPHSTSETIDRHTGRPSRSCRTRPRPPDLIVTTGDTSYEITLDA